ncbi:MAG: 1-acyl-sn-glycerol-3-phosphate acyltransferase, partial [Deltaproteobacteria bacterium]|nr:1-acyl-sn-glycerol-3-phosphate acyltransferase [Deltaproteobacteria bacterium]
LSEVIPSIATIWATRILQLIEGKLCIEGLEKLHGKNSHTIFLFTHKSFLDFLIASLVPIITAMRSNSKRRVPLFLLAMDHFKKNFILYRVIGIGKIAEALGMIFVNRSDSGNKDRATAVIESATKKLIYEDVDLAIFPQGTRVYPYPPQTDEPYEAGYYTVGSKDRLCSDGGHLKKGASFIATDVALSLASSGDSKPLKIVPVAIGGTAKACPRGKMRINSGIELRLTIGDPILLTASSVEDITKSDSDKFESDRIEFATKLHNRIDSSLKDASKIHSELERRFFKDTHDMLDPLQMDEVALAMKTWRGDDYLVHAILDCIYTCPKKIWRQLLGELTHNMLNFTDRNGLLDFKGKVASNIRGIK